MGSNAMHKAEFPLYRVGQRLVAAGLVRRVYRLDVAGAERIPSGAAILVANHESRLDPFVLAAITSRPIRYLAKEELWRWRWLGAIMDALGGVPVRRGSARAALTQATALLEGGELVALFPQGTVVPHRRRPFQRGAAHLALRTGAPLVPVCLVGTERALRPRRPRIGFPKLRVLVGSPISVDPTAPTIGATRALTERVESAIAELGRPYGPPKHVWIETPNDPQVRDAGRR
jgi:1-acyl-sn-glycerol-3-phosphate acyltransferase